MNATPPELSSVPRLPAAVLAAFLGVLAGLRPAGAQQSAEGPGAVRAPVVVPVPAGPPAVADFESFRFIGDWNIFNPTRVGRSSGEPAPAPVETISLVGTLSNGAGSLAIFTSPVALYRRAAREGEGIGPFTVTRISQAGVELLMGSRALALAVGNQLSRPEGGAWAVGGPAGTAAPAAPADDAPPPIPPDASEVLKRLMQKRQEQLKQ